MIKRQHTKNYERKMRYNKVEYITADGMFCTTHDVLVPFCMPELFSSKISNNGFHIDHEQGESGIGYDMIISRDLMVQIGLTADFKRQVLQWDGATVNMKGHSSLIGKYDLAKSDMHEVVMQTAEPASS